MRTRVSNPGQLRGDQDRRARLDPLSGDVLGPQEHSRQRAHTARRLRQPRRCIRAQFRLPVANRAYGAQRRVPRRVVVSGVRCVELYDRREPDRRRRLDRLVTARTITIGRAWSATGSRASSSPKAASTTMAIPAGDELVRIAAHCQADAVKFQKRTIHELLTRAALEKPYVNPNSLGATYGEHRLKLELSEADWYRLRDLATRNRAGVHGQRLGSRQRRPARCARHAGDQDAVGGADRPGAAGVHRAQRAADDRLDGHELARRGRSGGRTDPAPHRRADPAAVHVGLPERVRRHQPAGDGHVRATLRRAGRLLGPRTRHRRQRSGRDPRRVRRRAPLHQRPHAARARSRGLTGAHRSRKAGARHSPYRGGDGTAEKRIATSETPVRVRLGQERRRGAAHLRRRRSSGRNARPQSRPATASRPITWRN